MTALHRALAFAEVNQVAVVIAEDLDFDMMRALDQLFDVNAAVAEGAQSFAGGGFGGGGQIFGDRRGACLYRRLRPRLSALPDSRRRCPGLPRELWARPLRRLRGGLRSSIPLMRWIGQRGR